MSKSFEMDQNLYKKYVILIQVHYCEDVKLYLENLSEADLSLINMGLYLVN